MGSMILLNESGDITIEWTEEHEERMKELIKKKLDDGYTFFIIKKVFGFERKCRLRRVGDIKVGSKLFLKDDDAIRLFSEGIISAKATDDRKFDTTHSSKDVDEISKSDSLAVRPIAAG